VSPSSGRRAVPLRPSPALAVSLIALIVALGGTAYAGLKLAPASVGTRELRNGAVTAAKVRPHSLLAIDFRSGQLPKSGGSGGAGTPGGSGAPGSAGTPGQAGGSGLPGPPGAPGSARAYGHVLAAGTLDAARSKGITNVTHTASTGIYCLTPAAGVSPASSPIVASADESEATASSRAMAQANAVGADCAAGQFEVEVRKIELSTTTPTTTVAHHSDNGFTFMIP
jgi:hypothetical protein